MCENQMIYISYDAGGLNSGAAWTDIATTLDTCPLAAFRQQMLTADSTPQRVTARWLWSMGGIVGCSGLLLGLSCWFLFRLSTATKDTKISKTVISTIDRLSALLRFLSVILSAALLFGWLCQFESEPIFFNF